MKKQKKAEIETFFEMYKKEKGDKMKYNFKCESCGAEEEKEIALADYDKEKENQKCTCGGKMKRVIEWSGIATGSGAGWFGKSDGSNAI